MPRPKSDLRRYNLYLPEKLHTAYKQIAKRRGVPASELQRAALYQGIAILVAEELEGKQCQTKTQ